MNAKARIGAIYEWECYGPDGNLKWADKNHNLCTDQGLEHLLDVAFSDATQITDWYVAIFESDHTPAAGNTYAVPGYTESTAYNEATRPAWTEAGVSAKAITNSANKATFTMNATKTIYGAALVGGGTAATTRKNTAGGGKLFNLAQFSSGFKVVESADVLKVTITLTASDV
jgi:hypothetical protein